MNRHLDDTRQWLRAAGASIQRQLAAAAVSFAAADARMNRRVAGIERWIAAAWADIERHLAAAARWLVAAGARLQRQLAPAERWLAAAGERLKRQLAATQSYPPRRVMVASVLAALAVVLANYYAFPRLGTSLPFALFYPVLAVAGFLGGARPVIAAMAIGLISSFLWHPDVAATPPGAAFLLRCVFAFVGFTYALFSDAVVRERARAQAGEAAARELPEARARFAALAKTSPDMIWVWDLQDGRFLFISRAARKITGIPAEEMLMLSEAEYNSAVDSEDLPILDEALRTLRGVSDGQTVEYEYRYRHRQGHTVWLRNRAGVFHRDAAGAVTQVFGFTEDVTERRIAVEQLAAQAAELASTAAEREELLAAERVARTEAERANRLKDDFLATVSHELRTPLTAMLGWTSMLSEETKDPGLLEGLEIIGRNARAQKQLIEDLLDMSRILSGKVRIEPQPVLLGDVVAAAMETVIPAAEARGVALLGETEGCGEPIQADANRLQQIVWNLVSNAVKFTPAGGQVHILAVCAGNEATITVTDTGQGMAPEFVPHVFERFRQEDGATTRKAGGLGLGLAIVKHLAELHGGTVHAHSDGLGKGSVFTITLPLQSARIRSHFGRMGAPTKAAAAQAVEARRDALAGCRLLIIDDEADTRSYLHRVLTERGAQVGVAENAADGLERALADKPEAVICDISMPAEDGYSFIRNLRRADDPAVKATPAAALTALARAEDRQRALDAGFDEHCAKPVEPAELVALVARLLPGKKRRTRKG
jgi:PAS domain S-box-containing protein